MRLNVVSEKQTWQKTKGKKVEEVNFVEEVSLVAEVGPTQILEEHPSSCNLVEEKFTFIADFGYTSTMVRSANLLHNVKKAIRKVKLGGAATEILVVGMGNFPLPLISSKVQHIFGALLVPNLRKDLLSTSQVADAHMKVVFDASGVYFYPGDVMVHPWLWVPFKENCEHALRKLVQDKLVIGLDIAKIAIGFCEACVLGKHA
ncbi:hypothetical protein R1flu_027220 [Riccia fluitans]|uniref:Retrovirus-related Pol polyprotein from transposon TNT 1-94-like beta-barrel domain-containing protein n=1 Tax=Riccia fluitans TaxID=41844 RepID=A0ABD1XI53_9MARC